MCAISCELDCGSENCFDVRTCPSSEKIPVVKPEVAYFLITQSRRYLLLCIREKLETYLFEGETVNHPLCKKADKELKNSFLSQTFEL